MKVHEIAKKYQIDQDEFMDYVRKNKLKFEETFTAYIIKDEYVDRYVTGYKNEKERQRSIEKWNKENTTQNEQNELVLEVINGVRAKVAELMPLSDGYSQEQIDNEIERRVKRRIMKRLSEKSDKACYTQDQLEAEAERMIAYALDAEAEEKRKRKAMAGMLITSGFNFDGYTITKYSGYISGDDAVSVERGLAIFGVGTDVKDKLLNSLVEIRRNALRELKEAAYNLGCNAVIGVDFDYLTLDPQTANLGGGTTYLPYIFAVTANGNAVVIEKNGK